MTIQYKEFQRTPFIVKAVQITDENIAELATHLGTLKEKPSRDDPSVTEQYIAINRAVVPQIPRAFVGWWVTEMDDNYRCYSPKAFVKQFEPVRIAPVINIKS